MEKETSTKHSRIIRYSGLCIVLLGGAITLTSFLGTKGNLFSPTATIVGIWTIILGIMIECALRTKEWKKNPYQSLGFAILLFPIVGLATLVTTNFISWYHAEPPGVHFPSENSEVSSTFLEIINEEPTHPHNFKNNINRLLRKEKWQMRELSPEELAKLSFHVSIFIDYINQLQEKGEIQQVADSLYTLTGLANRLAQNPYPSSLFHTLEITKLVMQAVANQPEFLQDPNLRREIQKIPSYENTFKLAFLIEALKETQDIHHWATLPKNQKIGMLFINYNTLQTYPNHINTLYEAEIPERTKIHKDFLKNLSDEGQPYLRVRLSNLNFFLRNFQNEQMEEHDQFFQKYSKNLPQP